LRLLANGSTEERAPLAGAEGLHQNSGWLRILVWVHARPQPRVDDNALQRATEDGDSSAMSGPPIAVFASHARPFSNAAARFAGPPPPGA
jgi:hypothetical protein